MDAAKSDAVRAIAVVGPSGVGKSSLVRGLALTASGERGPLQPTLGQTLEIAISSIEFMHDRYALIDTPGALDFAADMDYALAGVDLALVVADPDPHKAALLQPFFHELERLGIPRALFINKIDQARGPIHDLLQALQPISAAPLVARQMLIQKDDAPVGFLDLGLEQAFTYRPGEPSARVATPPAEVDREAEERFHMLEQLADFDDDLMEQLLNDDTPTRETVFADLARETAEGLIAPVFFGAASQQYGLRRLLKALRHETPSPKRAAARLGLTSAAAYVLKIAHAGQVGKLAYARVFNEPMADTAEVVLSNGARVRTGALFAPRGAAAKKVASVAEGDIVAIGKIEPVELGQLLSKSPAVKGAVRPEPRASVFQLSIAAANRNDDVRLSSALAKLVEEDPGLSVSHDSDAHEILLHGQGEPHLRDAIARLSRRFNVDVTSTRPATPFRETIRKSTTQRGRHKKQTGGHGQFADVVLDLKPLARGEGFTFTDSISGGAVPRQWIPAVEQGVRDALEKGPLGFRVIDVSATLLDGSFHPVDSSEFAFRAAGRLAAQEALTKCDPILLEPIEKLAIFTPSSGTARINSLVSSRNGQILGFEAREGWPGWDKINVYLPHSERQDLITELRSLTQGLATFTAEFSHMVELTGRRADDAISNGRTAA